MRILASILAASFLTGCYCSTIETGHRGVETHFGKVENEQPYTEGLYFYNAFTSDIISMDTREQIYTIQQECYTKDTQHVMVDISINYRPDPAKITYIFKTVGIDYPAKIFHNKVISSLKDTVGQNVSDDLVNKRAVIAEAISKELAASAAPYGIIISSVSLANLKFDEQYETAVKAKVAAYQKALEAKNKTVEIEELSKQKIISAKAEAESMKIRSDALSQNKSLIMYEAVQKWSGALPTYMMGGNISTLFQMPSESVKK